MEHSFQELFNQVEKLKREGKYSEAEALLKGYLEKNGEDPLALNILGNIYYETERLEEAIELFQQALTLDPNFIFAYINLGASYKKLGHLEAAKRALLRALEINPSQPEALNNLANIYREEGLLLEAKNLYEKACELNPNIPEFFINLAIIHMDLEDYQGAEKILHQVLSRYPLHPIARRTLASLYVKKGELEKAEINLRWALNLTPNDPLILTDLAGILIQSEITFPKEAEELLLSALKINPHLPQIYQNLGTLYIILGKKDLAKEAYKKALELQPHNPTYLRLYAEYAEIEEENHPLIHKLKELEEKEKNPSKKMEIYFALSKIYEKLGNDELFFEYLVKANRLKRQTLQYNPSVIEKSVRIRCEVFSPENVKKLSGFGFPTKVPVFIIGMPRSGTTLLESMLDAHPEIYGAGELKFIAEVLKDGIVIEEILFTSSDETPEKVLKAPEGFFEVGRRYYEKLRLLSPNSKRIVDKMPHNYLNLGIILLSLPLAKVIHIKRHPLDTILSCFQQPFTEAHEYTYDLKELTHYYNQYFRLMKHWREVFPGRFLEVSYEELVLNPEETLKKICDYLEVPFTRECLEFYKKEKPVKTASQDQVRKPLYTSSIGRWKRFERYFKEVIELLDEEIRKEYNL